MILNEQDATSAAGKLAKAAHQTITSSTSAGELTDELNERQKYVTSFD